MQGVLNSLRKVHARAFCDESSDCAKGKNNFGEEESKRLGRI